jgi:AcrR family transcriptional regulator
MLFMIGKREQNRRNTHKKILDAARELVQESGSAEFSMPQLAETAGVALVTPYKHFDSKAGVLEALLKRSMTETQEAAQIERLAGIDPLDRIIHFAESGVQVFILGEELHRLLVMGMVKLSGEKPIPFIDQWAPLWGVVLNDAVEAGDVHRFIDVNLASRSLHIYWTGALWKWIGRESTNTQFLADVQYGIITMLLGIATDTGQPQLRHRFSEAERDLADSLKVLM